jgi:pyruvate,orthophosphate dikinase
MVELLGGKGANLAEMASLGLPVPPGFTITTEACRYYYANERSLPDGLAAEVEVALDKIGAETGAHFGSEENPLLVAVRSGARASMPGMMDTILNLGLNDKTVLALARRSNDDRFAFDSYRRFIQMYGDVVLGIDHGVFEDILDNYKNLNGFSYDTELTADDWHQIIAQYKDAIDAEGTPFPQDTNEQLWGAIGAVFGSWQNARAVTYRRLHDIPDDWGTAVNVQAMVFGNMGNTSATGVAFTRNPSTGANEIMGEYLINAQGEDVVSGIRTPQPLTLKARRDAQDLNPSLEEEMPTAFEELRLIFAALENRYRDMQDIEFTIQNGKVWMLQTRSGKRTTEAAIRIASDLADEGILTHDEAVLRVEPAGLTQLLHPTIDPGAANELLTTGLPASPGAASGEIVFNSEDAERLKQQGHSVILVRTETSPEDIHGMHASAGILTARGGMTSHAAVVARGMGVPCVSGAGALRINEKAGTVSVGQKHQLKAGDVITIDGASGRVYAGAVPMRQPQLSEHFARLIAWADEARGIAVRANADTPKDARQAKSFGAQGIGLCRTEHMFFDAERILAMREMICATSEAGRRAALAKILPVQRGDFVELFEIMGELPVTIRLLDPPLHEFLPRQETELAAVAEALKMPLEKLKARVAELSEFNPMLGMRGSRLAIRYPEITEMQARAIFEAAIEASRRLGAVIEPEIMIPLVAYRREFDILAAVIRRTAEAVERETGTHLAYKLGTMIELPRACIRAGDLAEGEDGADFFSFGTNDLTQTVLGLSRDDASPILTAYAQQGVYEADPFVSLDDAGVGELVSIGVERGRAKKPGLKVGICGEHGGDPDSVTFFSALGIDYVSCSPFRVPIARLAAAQAAIRAGRAT